VLVAAAFLLRASALVAYPWDWSPDEGLNLDYARRALENPASLWVRSAVPFPVAYGPLLPFLMAPLVRLPDPLLGARLAALAWCLLAAGGLFVLVRGRAGTAAAAAGVAVLLGTYDQSYWFLLVRVDGPMIALWLWSAVVLLPRSLEPGADRLSASRVAAGTTLVLLAVLAKPTAVLHGAPLVLGWWLVDRRSALRLAAATLAGGLACLLVMQLATHGAFLWVNRLWGVHHRLPGLTGILLVTFLEAAWPVILLAAIAGVAAARSGARPWRDPSLLLVVGGLAIVPLLGKHGASWNYTIPLYVALVVTALSWAAGAVRAAHGPFAARLRPVPVLAAAGLALLLAATRTFPLPTAEDRATARAFYGYTAFVEGRAGGPVLVGRPDLVYFRAGQPVEIEGSSFASLATHGVAGTETVIARLRERRYTLVVETWPWLFDDVPGWREALEAGYRHVGGCELGWYFGRTVSHISLRRDLDLGFVGPPGTRCAAASPPRDEPPAAH